MLPNGKISSDLTVSKINKLDSNLSVSATNLESTLTVFVQQLLNTHIKWINVSSATIIKSY